MQLVDCLGCPLKSDEVLDLIRAYDMRVIYEVDTLQENVPDRYSAESPDAGFELGFNEDQVLVTIFCHVSPTRDFSAIDPSLIGVPLYTTIAAARSGATAWGASCEVRENLPAFGRVVSFAKLGFPDHWRHYEYDASGLHLITMMSVTPVSG